MTQSGAQPPQLRGNSRSERSSATPSPRFEAIFFDLGGTLLFPHPEHLSEVWAGFSSRKIESELWLHAIPRATVGLDALQLAEQLPAGDWWHLYFGRMVPLLGLTDAAGELIEGFVAALKAHHGQRNLWCLPAAGVHDVLHRLTVQGYYLGVVSNSDGRVREQLEEHDLRRFFRFHLDSHLVGHSKPAPEIFQIALKISGFSARNVLYVGDFASIDGVGATHAGMQALILDPLGIRTVRPFPQIASIADLPAWLQGRTAGAG